jgi:hypothetical protein
MRYGPGWRWVDGWELFRLDVGVRMSIAAADMASAI